MKKTLLISVIGVGALSVGMVYAAQQENPYAETEETSEVSTDEEVSANDNTNGMEELSMNNENESGEDGNNVENNSGEVENNSENQENENAENENPIIVDEHGEAVVDQETVFAEQSLENLTEILLNERYEDAEPVAFAEGKQDEAEQLLFELHESMNHITANAAPDEYGEASFSSLTSDMYYLSSYLLEESAMRYDIEKSAQLFMYGAQNENTTSLQYSLRILNDLDVFINGDGEAAEEEIFDVTETFGTADAIEEMNERVLSE